MFDKYNKKIKKRITKLLSFVIDNNVKIGIDNPEKIVNNFIREITTKEMDTWISLRKYINSNYFYNECMRYVKEKIPIYKERYKKINQKGKISIGQMNYLIGLISEGVNHKDYKIRKKAKKELGNILSQLSKSNASMYIDKFKEILGYNKNKNEDEQKNKNKEN